MPVGGVRWGSVADGLPCGRRGDKPVLASVRGTAPRSPEVLINCLLTGWMGGWTYVCYPSNKWVSG